ncbi:hypothetical protein H9I49_16290 [Terrabacter sp. MAHUQ-38]|nr:hypothetical protein [Terrabacter sp. MAHUQ-38]
MMADEPLDFGEDPFERAFGQLRGPVHWPSLTGEEARSRLGELQEWVHALVRRFAIEPRVIPPCWDRHSALVEILSALRDHERADYADTASPTAALDFIRALHDAQLILADHASKTQCSVSGHRDDLVVRWPTSEVRAAQRD